MKDTVSNFKSLPIQNRYTSNSQPILSVKSLWNHIELVTKPFFEVKRLVSWLGRRTPRGDSGFWDCYRWKDTQILYKWSTFGPYGVLFTRRRKWQFEPGHQRPKLLQLVCRLVGDLGSQLHRSVAPERHGVAARTLNVVDLRGGELETPLERGALGVAVGAAHAADVGLGVRLEEGTGLVRVREAHEVEDARDGGVERRRDVLVPLDSAKTEDKKERSTANISRFIPTTKKETLRKEELENQEHGT